MGLKLLEFQLCLLLLLGLLLTRASCNPPTPSQKFVIQHIYNDEHPRCDDAMRVVNSGTGRCKDLNTFLHTTFADVVDVCRNRPTNCRDGISRNCHDSPAPVPVTICTLTNRAGNYAECTYHTTEAKKSYTVACNNRATSDSPTYPLVPVHLDRTF